MSKGFLGHLISHFFANKNSQYIPVSIILPAYNAASTLGQTVASVQAQTVPDWEVIIVDDGSDDNTPALAAQFAAQDERIRTVSQPNQGVSAARNTGIAIARYDWLLFLDADDTLAASYLEKMTAPLNLMPGLDVVVCRIEKVTSDGVLIGEVTYKGLDSLFAESAQRCPFNLIACIARKQLVQSVGCFDVALEKL
ncbi:MAG: glycosyltransferase [Nodosilinea sp. WJT8-NPBG4]|jgi:glycosyltransferase involved in cell wall biosynthesis|nr:glycosyltransferase [Nodosilinea sp. WJT8-NPBG4]